MKILSLNLNHDGSAVVLDDGKITGYVNTERFSRVKKHPGLRAEDLRELLDQAGTTLAGIDHVMFNQVGVNYPEILEMHGKDFEDTRVPFAIDPSRQHAQLMGVERPCTVNLEHFLCHAACAYYFSPFDSAYCFAYDPMGSGAYVGRGNRLDPLKFAPALAGLLYSQVSIELLKLGGLFGAGKAMGLAPYGSIEDVAGYEELRSLCAQGVPRSDVGKVLDLIRRMGDAHPIPVRDGGKEWNAAYAFLVQEALEMGLAGILDGLFRLMLRRRLSHGEQVGANLCLAGGTALNSVANQKCFEQSKFSSLYMHPACGDDGTAIGAALYYWHHSLGQAKTTRENREAMYSVRTYDDRIEAAISRHADQLHIQRSAEDTREAASLIAQGRILGWFDGASEIGPRALGHRSILCNAAHPGMKDTLNARIKFRESFRPFAPSVLNEHAEAWFGLKDSPFMLRVANVLRPGVPAITHVDGTARHQTVRTEDNPRFHRMISEFHALTGVPMVLNTSFNVKGEPIVESPEDALATFLGSELDHLVFPGIILSKR
jgi:carbamoyltransferase